MMTKERIFWIDFIRAVAVFLVVVLHCSADLFYDFQEIPMLEWFAALFYGAVSHISVPLFIMASGAILLTKDESLGRYLTWRIGRFVLIILIWSIIYVGYKIVFENFECNFLNVFLDIFKGPVYFHLWFLYTLLGIYLLLPVYRPFVQHALPSEIWYFIVLWLLVLIVLPSLEFFLGLTSGVNLTQFGGFVGYFIIGFLLNKLASNKLLTAAMIPVAIISLIATIVRTYIASEDVGAVNETFFSYLGPNIIFTSIASFWLLRLLGEAVERRVSLRVKQFISQLSQSSLGIYLVHPIVMKLFALYFGFSPYTGTSFWSIPLVAIIVTCVSFGITWIIKKVPGSQWVV